MNRLFPFIMAGFSAVWVLAVGCTGSARIHGLYRGPRCCGSEPAETSREPQCGSGQNSGTGLIYSPVADDPETEYLTKRVQDMRLVQEGQYYPLPADLPPIVGSVWRIERPTDSETPDAYKLVGELLKDVPTDVFGEEVSPKDFRTRQSLAVNLVDEQVRDTGVLVVPVLAGAIDLLQIMDGGEVGGPTPVSWRWALDGWPPVQLRSLQALTVETSDDMGKRRYLELKEELTLRVSNADKLGSGSVSALAHLVWWKMGAWVGVSSGLPANAAALVRPNSELVYERLILRVSAVEQGTITLTIRTLGDDARWPTFDD